MKIKDNQQSASFTIVYEFNASKELVFNAFSNADALGEWWGTVECKNTVLKLDFRKGGTFHYKMEKDGNINYGRFVLGEIVPHELLEFTDAFSDASGNVLRAPFDMPFPLEIFYRISFAETNGKTIITMTGRPVTVTTDEMEGFKSINKDMQKGFGATFGKLAAYLKTIHFNHDH